MCKYLTFLAVCFISMTACGKGVTHLPAQSGTIAAGGGDAGCEVMMIPGNGTGAGMKGDAGQMGLPSIGCNGTCDAPPDASVPSPAGATAKLGDPCTANSQCESGLCFPFNSRGPHCSAPCTEGCQCPASRGCSNMGICKAP